MRRFNLQLFADGGEEGTGTTGTERHETGYSFEQAEEIATASIIKLFQTAGND